MTEPGPALPETVRFTSPARGVRLLTLDRPGRMNAIGPAEARGMFTAIAAFRDDPDASVLVITGSGHDAFCAGADLAAVSAMFSDSPAAEPLFDPRDPEAVPFPAEGNIGPTRWADVHKPVIAAVNGVAYAGGLEWACFAHLRIADQHASFGVTCRRWNVGLGDGGTQRLPRLIGLSRALDLIITGRVIGAEEAERIGLVNEVTESGSCLDRALQLAGQIAALPQPALRTDLEAAVRGFGQPLEQGLEVERECFNRLLHEPELAEGARRFVRREHPDRGPAAAPLFLPGKAYSFAAAAHGNQPGKYGLGRFIEHPARVARIVSRSGGDRTAVAGAYLHDTLEHTATITARIEAAFGPRVAGLVAVLSQNPEIGDCAARRAEHRDRIETADSVARLIWIADRLDGIESLSNALDAGVNPDRADLDRRVAEWRSDLELARTFGVAPDLTVRATEALDLLG